MPSDTPRTVVVGAASGIGLAVADSLESDTHNVCRLDVRGAQQEAFDVTSERDWEHLDLTNVTGLVITAGVRVQKSIADTNLSDWDAVMHVNATGTFLGLRRIAWHLQSRSESGDFSVVLMSSGVVSKSVPDQAAYNASKHAIEGLVRTAAIELAPFGARVNAVAPGSIATPMTEVAWSHETHAKRMQEEIPLARPGTVGEVASVVSTLLSSATLYVNGAVWTVDGGWTL